MLTEKKLKIIHTEASPHWGGAGNSDFRGNEMVSGARARNDFSSPQEWYSLSTFQR